MSTTYKEFRTEDNKPILVEAAKRDGSGKNIENNYAKQAGYYGAMGVGNADEAKSIQTSVGNEDKTPFGFMTVGGQSDVTTGIQKLQKLVGVNLVKNQLIKITTAGSGTVVNDYTAILPYVLNSYYHMTDAFTTVAGHKYLLVVKTEGANWRLVQQGDMPYLGAETCKAGYMTVVTASGSDVNELCMVNQEASETEVDTKIECRFIDLTQMFGNNTVLNAILGDGNTASQIANLMLFLAGWLPTTFDAGSFLEPEVAELISRGFNQWDEQWEKGTYNADTGVKNNADRLRCKNPIRVLPGQTYYFRVGANSGGFLYWYDASGNYLGRQTQSRNSTFVVPRNAAYMTFNMYSEYGDGTSYANDICINLSWGAERDGEYEPSNIQRYQMPKAKLHGILKVGTDSNGDPYIYADGDEIYPNQEGNKKRYAKVRLGSLAWTWETSNNRFYATLPYKAGGEPNATYNWIFGNVRISNAYDNKGNQDDKSFFIYMGSAQKSIYICDSAYAGNASALQTSLANVYVIYELDESEQEEFEADAFPENIFGDDWGTFQFLDENGNEIVGLQGAEFFYKANVAGFAESVGIKANWDPDKILYEADKTELNNKDNLVNAAVGGTLRNCLAVKENLNFRDTDVLDLSIFDWTYEAANHRFYTRTSNNIMKAAATSATKAKILCTEYENTDSGTASSNPAYNCIALDNSNPNPYIIIHDSRFENASQLKAALKNVLLAYEKASS